MDMKAMESQLERAKKLAGELVAQLEVIEGVLKGDSTPGQNINRLFRTWGAEWARRYRTAYVTTNRAKLAAQLKRLLGSLSVEDIEARMGQYLADNDRFYTQAKHSLDLFLVSVNKFSGTGHDGEDADFLTSAPPDCRHTPRCQTDTEHTRRLSAELRGRA